MIYLNTLPNLTFSRKKYRMAKVLPLGSKGVIAFPGISDINLLAKYMKDTITEFQNHYISTGYVSVYTPRTISETITGTKIYTQADQKRSYAMFKSVLEDKVKNYFNNITNYTKHNILLDTSTLEKQLFAKVKKTNDGAPLSLIKVYLNYIKEVTPDYLHYNLILPITDDMKVPLSATSLTNSAYKNHSTVIWYLLHCLHFNFDETFELLKGFNICFVSTAGIANFDMTATTALIISGKITPEGLLKKLLVTVNRVHTGTVIIGDDADDEENKHILLEDDDGELYDDEETTNNFINTHIDEVKESDMTLMGQHVKSVVNQPDENKRALASAMLTEIKNNIQKNSTNIIHAKEQKIIDNIPAVGVGKQSIEDLNQQLAIAKVKTITYPVTTIDNLNESKFANMNQTYDKIQKNIHIKKIAEHFSKLPVPLYIQKIEVNDISTDLEYLDEYKFTFKDRDALQHTLTLHIPKTLDGKFYYLSGSKKMLSNQFVSLPITKVGEDVIVTANYNKVFISYKGDKYISASEAKLISSIKKANPDDIDDKIVLGDYYEDNLL